MVDPAPLAARQLGVSRIIEIVDRGDGIQIVAQGPIDNFDSYMLQEPRRLIVDFWGVQSEVAAENRGADGGPVAEIRVREYSGRVRMVIDLRTEVLSHRIQATATGAEIVLDVSGDG